MTEEVLQHIWQYQIYEESEINKLETVDGSTVHILYPGVKNTNQGPDFLNAKISIDEIEWNGSVEIHTKSSLWKTHKHHLDANYENVVLHVVYEDDSPVSHNEKEVIPCLELKNILKPDFLKSYDEFMKSESTLACENLIESCSSLVKRSMLERAMVERLERKSELFESWWKKNDKDWEQTCFEVIAYCLGLKVNADTFYLLSSSINYKLVYKYKDNPLQVESLFFGMAEFELPKELEKEYSLLKHKHELASKLEHKYWKYHRLRPAAFPEVRILQLISVVLNNEFMFSKIKEITEIKGLKNLFKNSFASVFLEGNKSQKIGNGTVDLILINGILPLLYLLYRKENNPEYLNRIMYFLENMKAEKNSVLEKMSPFFEISNAHDSQSILELYNNYCSQKNCLNCSIGKSVLS